MKEREHAVIANLNPYVGKKLHINCMFVHFHLPKTIPFVQFFFFFGTVKITNKLRSPRKKTPHQVRTIVIY